MDSAATVRSPLSARWRKPAAVLFLLGWFGWFNWDAVRVHFAPDDMMNLAHYWKISPPQLVLLQFMPWRGAYRPMGGLFYRSMLEAFGLNPGPYHLFILAVLLANVGLIYWLARILGSDRFAAFFAALLACYHAGLAVLYYDTAFAFDALCSFFYLAALVYYGRIRKGGAIPGLGQTAAFLGLYLCAINSKEMALTLPALLLVYEWYYGKPSWDVKAPAAWLRGPGRAILLAAAIAFASFYGAVLRPNGLATQPDYRPVLSRGRFLDFHAQALSDVLQQNPDIGRGAAMVILLVMFYLAWRRERRALRFCWVAWMITTVPIAVLVGRRAGCLAVPFPFLAVFASMVFVDLARAGAADLSRTRALQRVAQSTLLTAVVVSGVALWGWQNVRTKRLYVRPPMIQLGQDTWAALDELRRVNPQVRPHSTLVFLDDPFEEYDMALIAELWFRDRSLIVRLHRKTPLTPEELSRADYLFTFKRGTLTQLR